LFHLPVRKRKPKKSYIYKTTGSKTSFSAKAHTLRHSPKTRLPWSLTQSLELTLDVAQQIYLDLKPRLCTLQSISVKDPAQVVQQKQMIPANSDETLCAGMPVHKE